MGPGHSEVTTTQLYSIATIAWDVDGVDTLKQTRREKGRVTRKRLQDTPSRIPPQTPIPALLVSSSEHQIFPYLSFTNRPGITIAHRTP